MAGELWQLEGAEANAVEGLLALNSPRERLRNGAMLQPQGPEMNVEDVLLAIDSQV